MTRNRELHIKEEHIINSDTEIQADENNHDISVGEVDQTQSEHASLVTLNDADDEFYDVPEPSDCDVSENGWMTECSHQKSQVKIPFEIFAFIAQKRSEHSKVKIQFVSSRLILRDCSKTFLLIYYWQQSITARAFKYNLLFSVFYICLFSRGDKTASLSPLVNRHCFSFGPF